MALHRQNSTQEVQSQMYGSRLQYKQSVIQRLQAEVLELTQNKLDYKHSEETIQKLKKKVTDAEKDKEKSDWNQKDANRNMEANLTAVKNQFENLSLTYKSKGGELEDLLAEKSGLEEIISLKNSQIEALKGRADIQYEQKRLGTEYQVLAHQEQLVKNQVKQLQEEIEKVEKANKDISRNISNKEAALLSLKLQIQNKDRKLDYYEKENNAIDAQVQDILAEQTKVLKQICECQNLQKELELNEVTLKSKLKKLQNQLEEINKMIKTYEKEKNREAKQGIKNKENTLRKINDAQQAEHAQINALVKRNGQIAQINNRLKQDSQFCEDHLTNVRRCNELMIEFLQKCRSEDKSLIEVLQKRLVGTSNVIQKPVVSVNNNSKMSYSRSTQNSSWLNQ